MKRVLLYCVFVVFLNPFPAFCQNSADLNISMELSIADLHKKSKFNGHQMLIKLGKEISTEYGVEAGVSLSQSINEGMSYNSKIVKEPTRIRKAYNRSSFDIFAGLNFNPVDKFNFSFPLAIGISPRIRTESYPDPKADLDVELYSIDENGERVYAVITKTIYARSFDLGLYGSVGVTRQIFYNWKISLKSRYKFYTEGFSVFTVGVGAHYYF